MTYKSVLLAVLFVILAMSLAGCGEAPTVDAVVEHQTEARENVKCEYTFISTDVQVRLAHYRICKDDDDSKRAKALEKALQDCYDLCSENHLSGTSDYTDCIAQCDAE